MIFVVNGARNPNLLFWTTQTPVGMTRRAEATTHAARSSSIAYGSMNHSNTTNAGCRFILGATDVYPFD